MKNPFEKNDHKVLIAGVIIGSAIAGAAAYLFLTETGGTVRQQLAGHFNRMRDAFLGTTQQPEPEATPAYLQHPTKKPKTDREALLKHEIITADHHDEPENQA